MTIIRPGQLLEQADLLVQYSGGQQVALRRAVSASYYALFHTATVTIADYVVGRVRRSSPEWSLAYRSIDHARLRNVCQTIDSGSGKYKPFVPPSLFTSDFKAYARAVIELQQQRHDADYNPAASFKVGGVNSIVSVARAACDCFAKSTDDEKRMFVCLLIFQPR
jgi:hypothetical protein